VSHSVLDSTMQSFTLAADIRGSIRNPEGTSGGAEHGDRNC
jgi:hypothetical protein